MVGAKSSRDRTRPRKVLADWRKGSEHNMFGILHPDCRSTGIVL
jgi:hypothetical protein